MKKKAENSKTVRTPSLNIVDVSNSTSIEDMIDKRFKAVEYWAKLVYDGEIDLIVITPLTIR